MSTDTGQSVPPGLEVTGQGVDERQRRQRQVEEMVALSEEEKAVMEECKRESLYLRALPMGFGAMVGAQMLVKSGRWQPHHQWGAWPKTLVAGGLGYFFGKLSYVRACQDKILEKIPNSNLGRKVRDMRNPGAATEQNPAYEYEQPSTRKQQDDDYKNIKGLDDRFRPTMDNEIKEKEVSPEQKRITYDDLRKRNRQTYEDELNKRSNNPPKSDSYKNSPFMPQKPWPDPPASQPNDDYLESKPTEPVQPKPRRKRTNMWGDEIEG